MSNAGYAGYLFRSSDLDTLKSGSRGAQEPPSQVCYLQLMAALVNTLKDLPRYLRKVARVFDLERLKDAEISASNVAEYYRLSAPGYDFFHSREGSVHMALNFDGKYSPEGYRAQAEIVGSLVPRNARRILELGSGKGFNTLLLATERPGIQFTGLDLSPVHVAAARRRSKDFQNVHFVQADFGWLPLASDQFDLVFEVESICHTTSMRLVLQEAYRVLKPGGYFVVFDGFREKPKEETMPEVEMALELVERAMAVPLFMELSKWVREAEEVGLSVTEHRDLSAAVEPNLARLQFLARGFFKFPWLARLIKASMSDELVANSVAGLLMPFTFASDAHGYHLVVLQKV